MDAIQQAKEASQLFWVNDLCTLIDEYKAARVAAYAASAAHEAASKADTAAWDKVHELAQKVGNKFSSALGTEERTTEDGPRQFISRAAISWEVLRAN